MGQILLLLVVALVAAALVFGVVTLLTGGDQGLEPVEPDGIAVPLPVSRPLTEVDLDGVRFDTAMRGYRMAQVDQALRRAAYDLGYKEELINVLEAEVSALREGRVEDAEAMRRARESAARPAVPEDEAPPAVVAEAAADTAPDTDTDTAPAVDATPSEGGADGDGDADEAGPTAAETEAGPTAKKPEAGPTAKEAEAGPPAGETEAARTEDGPAAQSDDQAREGADGASPVEVSVASGPAENKADAQQ